MVEGEGGCVRKKSCGVDWVSNQELISLRWALFLVRFTFIVKDYILTVKLNLKNHEFFQLLIKFRLYQ